MLHLPRAYGTGDLQTSGLKIIWSQLLRKIVYPIPYFYRTLLYIYTIFLNFSVNKNGRNIEYYLQGKITLLKLFSERVLFLCALPFFIHWTQTWTIF